MHSWLYLYLLTDCSALTALHLPFVVVVRNSKVYATLVILPSCFARQGPTFWNWENFTTFPHFGDTDIKFFLFLKTHLVGFFGCSQIYWPGHHPKWPHLLFLFFFFWFLCGILCRFFCAILCLTNILAWPPPQMTPPDGVLVQMRCNIYHIMGHTLTTKYCFYSKGSSQLKQCVLWRQISQTKGGI